MGNNCCPSSNPCDHTVDETQGLLNSPDSKVTARPLTTDGVVQALEVEESRKNEADYTNQEKDVAGESPKSAGGTTAHSYYGTVIQMLHTEVSLATQTSQSASSPVSKVSEEPVDADSTSTVLPKDEAQNPATQVSVALTVKEPTELTTAKLKEETKSEINKMAKTDKADERGLMALEAMVEGPNVKEDTQNMIAQADTEKKPTEADLNEDSVKMTTNEADEVDILPSMDTIQTHEPPLIDSSVDEIKACLNAVDIGENTAAISILENTIAETLGSSSQPVCEVDKLELATEKPVYDENHEEHVVSNMSEMKEDGLPAKTHEPSEQEFSPEMHISDETTVNGIEKDQTGELAVDDDNKDMSPAKMDVEILQVAEVLQKPHEDTSHIETPEPICEPLANRKSAVCAEAMQEAESTDAAEVQKTTTECVKTEGDVGEAFQNGLHTPAPVEQPEQHFTENEPESKAATSPTKELDHVFKEKMDVASQQSKSDVPIANNEKQNAEDIQARKGEITFSSSDVVSVALIPVIDLENIAEKEDKQKVSEDLYRGGDEIEQEQARERKALPLLQFTIPGVKEKCSLAAAVDMLVYSEREWKGNTAKSSLIRKGYSDISCSFTGLRRVRGDNYCSLRATLYQVLATTTQTPAWLLEKDFTSLPEKLEVEEHLISMWAFPPQCVKEGETEDGVEKLTRYLELLQKRWQEAAGSESLEDKQAVCEDVFQGGEEEYALLEVVKFLMLVKAVEFYRTMQAEQEVPVFCWLLFARDTSENPKMFFSNHLSQVGFTGGLEQVEMFLLGYALQHTIQAFRLYKTDTEEFVTHYPDDHKHDWPCVCIVTEDDRHYNVPVRKPTQYRL